MGKPIFIARFPETADQKRLNEAAQSLGKMGLYDDYHVLIIRDQFTGGEIKFECYNAPHTEMEFKKLQERVLTLLQNNKP
jgi:hypothetical protein